jgi:hypothetical protein
LQLASRLPFERPIATLQRAKDSSKGLIASYILAKLSGLE